MIISDEYHYIFIGIPRTGTKSIRKALNKIEQKDLLCGNYHLPPGHKDTINHATAIQIKNLNSEKWNDYFKFTFVRNPWDRVISWYSFFGPRKKNEFTKWLTQNYYQDSIKETNIEKLSATYNKEKIKVNNLKNYKIDYLLPCADWILDEKGNIAIDYIGRYENLTTDWDIICNKIGIQAKLPHIHKSIRDHYSTYYTEETKQIIADRFRKDLEYFDYHFEKVNRFYIINTKFKRIVIPLIFEKIQKSIKTMLKNQLPGLFLKLKKIWLKCNKNH